MARANPETQKVEGFWGASMYRSVTVDGSDSLALTMLESTSPRAKRRQLVIAWFEEASFVPEIHCGLGQLDLAEAVEEFELNQNKQMKIRYQIAAAAASAILAGCSGNDTMIGQTQGNPAPTNERRDAAGTLTNEAPAPAVPPAANPVAAPPPTQAATTDTNVPPPATPAPNQPAPVPNQPTPAPNPPSPAPNP
jgi:hypothetical protein